MGRLIMKHVFATILVIGLSSGVCFAGEGSELTGQKDKESYSFGYSFGQNLKARGLTVNLDVYAAAIRDALSGANPALSQADMRLILSEMEKKDGTEGPQGAIAEKAKRNLAIADAFLAMNKAKDGVKTLPNGVQYKMLKEGSGKIPNATDEVTVNLRATLTDGTEIGNTFEGGKPVVSAVDRISFGWADALKLMKEGSTWQVFVPPNLAYGARDRGNVPANSVIVFEVELLSIK
jgi:FKBP-type peptidyl-prolyl cis-trans isomerase FklB